ncbi:nuclear transport factor 2 family protein [Robiginitalea sp. IMCC44478]|uniref:nuclear transport factor 2 family protein n=1 Tax=Robiginitalea sp. IMCC44478 TaxID=3459122 RepID=UPI00404158C4
MKKVHYGLLALVLIGFLNCREVNPEMTAETQMTESSLSPDYEAFQKKVEWTRAFIKAHCDEDLAAISEMLADSLVWSPPSYNGNQWLGKEDLLAALKNYHDAFDNIQFEEGIVTADTTAAGFWSGSVYPMESASNSPNIIRVYGTWKATHTESGKDVGVKFYNLISFNEDGKMVSASDYFDANGIAVQLATED